MGTTKLRNFLKFEPMAKNETKFSGKMARKRENMTKTNLCEKNDRSCFSLVDLQLRRPNKNPYRAPWVKISTRSKHVIFHS